MRLLLALAALLALVDPSAAAPRAELFQRAYTSKKGTVDLLAESRADGKTLHLSDIAIYPRGAKKLELGMHDLLRLKNHLLADAHAQGFSKLHVTGTRLTGAKPGKTPDLWFDVAPSGK